MHPHQSKALVFPVLPILCLNYWLWWSCPHHLFWFPTTITFTHDEIPPNSTIFFLHCSFYFYIRPVKFLRSLIRYRSRKLRYFHFGFLCKIFPNHLISFFVPINLTFNISLFLPIRHTAYGCMWHIRIPNLNCLPEIWCISTAEYFLHRVLPALVHLFSSASS